MVSFGICCIPSNFILMCDTFVHIPPDKRLPVIFGKNSDREPNEAQHIVRYPRLTREKNVLQTSYIAVEHPRDVFEVILSKPFQLWGAEIGINEYHVVIGNEAVFTKIPFEKNNKGLTGMDLIRLSLEISKTAREALEKIIFYLEKYGQDACGGYENKDFYYHNSFIIADKLEAYVLETAGNFWVYEKAEGHRAISNGLSIEENYDGIADGAIDFARKKNRIKKEEIFNFKKAFSAFLMPKLAQCEFRRNSNENLGNSFMDFSIGQAMQILRSHKTGENYTPYFAQPDSLCMHASGILSPNQTTGSMIVVLQDDPTIWMTGSSSPCLSLYKPFYLGDILLNEENFIAPSAVMDHSYWWQWEKFNRGILKNYTERKKLFQDERNVIEQKWIEQENALRKNNASKGSFCQFSKNCLDESKILLNKWSQQISSLPAKKHFFYDKYWSKQNNKANFAP